ncbi:hypothetical protein P9Z80_24580 [Bacillus cereus]|nr:hypothetical protein [Bacillus cereus]MEC3258785.1 hypothetical protein [Bacillus cereus]
MRSVDFKGFSEYDRRSLFEVRLNNDVEAATFLIRFNMKREHRVPFVEANADKYDKCLVKVVFSSELTRGEVETEITDVLSGM